MKPVVAVAAVVVPVVAVVATRPKVFAQVRELLARAAVLTAQIRRTR